MIQKRVDSGKLWVMYYVICNSYMLIKSQILKILAIRNIK